MFSLSRNWYIQSSGNISSNGSKISSSEYNCESWYTTEIPSTIIQTLAKNQVFPDPLFSLNLKKMAGYKGNHKKHLANIKKPKNSPYRQS